MKRTFYLAAALLLAIVLLAGCGGGSGEPKTDNVITIGLPKQSAVTSYGADNALTAWLEEKTGYDIEIVEFETSASDYKKQLADMIASGEKLPDILFGFKIGEALTRSYGQQGYFIDLKPYYENEEKSAPLWNKINDMPEDARKWLTYKLVDPDTGAYYAFPNGNVNVGDRMRYQPWINQQWLDRLGLPMPQNTEDLIKVLTAFRDEDANGNGDKTDEIPCMGSSNTMAGDVVSWLINMKMQVDMNSWVNLDASGVAYAPAVTDEYREALKWVHDLMAAGLVNPLSVSTNSTNLKKYVVESDLIGIALGHSATLFSDHTQIANWSPMPIWGYSYFAENALSLHTFITEDCENPDAAWDLMMLFYTDEGEYRCRFGEPGKNWDWAEEGALTSKGTPAVVKFYGSATKEEKTTSFWRVYTCLGTKLTSDISQVNENTSAASKEYSEKTNILQESYIQASNQDTGNITVQHGLMWTEEQKKAAPYRDEVTKMFKSYTEKFCTGKLDPYSQTDWDGYLRELKDATFETWLRVIQDVVKNSRDHGIK